MSLPTQIQIAKLTYELLIQPENDYETLIFPALGLIA